MLFAVEFCLAWTDVCFKKAQTKSRKNGLRQIFAKTWFRQRAEIDQNIWKKKNGICETCRIFWNDLKMLKNRWNLFSHFDKIVDSFQMRQIVVIDVDAEAKEKSGVASVNNLNTVYNCNKNVYETLKSRNSTKFVCFASRTVISAWTSSISFCFSVSSY